MKNDPCCLKADGLDPNLWKAAGIFQNTSRDMMNYFFLISLISGVSQTPGSKLVHQQSFPLVNIIREAKGKEETLITLCRKINKNLQMDKKEKQDKNIPGVKKERGKWT